MKTRVLGYNDVFFGPERITTEKIAFSQYYLRRTNRYHDGVRIPDIASKLQPVIRIDVVSRRIVEKSSCFDRSIICEYYQNRQPF